MIMFGARGGIILENSLKNVFRMYIAGMDQNPTSALIKMVPFCSPNALQNQAKWDAAVLPSHSYSSCLSIAAPPTSVTTEKLLITSRAPHSNGLEDSALLLYPLLTLSLVLLFASLSLAVIVFLRGGRVKRSKTRPTEARDIQESVIQHIQDDAKPWQSSKGQRGIK